MEVKKEATPLLKIPGPAWCFNPNLVGSQKRSFNFFPFFAMIIFRFNPNLVGSQKRRSSNCQHSDFTIGFQS